MAAVEPVTQKDIARMLGINRSTVTRALAGHPGISEELRQRVVELSRSLGYQKNYSASSLTTRKTRVISVLHCHGGMYIGDIHALWIARLYHCICERGYMLRLDTVDQLERIAATQAADGFVLFGSPEEIVGPEELPAFSALMQSSKCTIVRVDCSVEVPLNAVAIDGTGGTAEAVYHLVDLGHEKIAYFGNIKRSFICGDRHRGYVTALNNRGIAAPSHLTLDLDDWIDDLDILQSYAETLRQWIGDGVTAIVTPSDIMAIGVVKILRTLGLRVPDDISVVGFDDGKLAKLPDPPLTTVRQDIGSAAEAAVDMLMEMLDGKSGIPSKRIRAPLIIRGSTAPAKRAGENPLE